MDCSKECLDRSKQNESLYSNLIKIQTNDMEGGVVQLCHSAHLVMKVVGQVGQLDIIAFELQKNKRREEGAGGGVGVYVGVIAGTSRRLHSCLKTLERKSLTGFLSSVVGAPAYPWRRVSQIQQVCCNAGLRKFK